MLDRLRRQRDLALVAAVFSILVILFSPIPPAVLDLAIIANFGLSLTILLLTFYVTKPVEFSTFPSLLLMATLYRLSLNVAATRLILTGSNAGAVIGSIGTFAVQGNYIVGLVVFAILVVVQYVVVTSGAQRVSEVAARFTLDSMPGQQMSIDADLNMGLIDQTEAVRRRRDLEREASFYGAMDGASKFVKGDAIAGIIILLIDILAGWIVGVAQLGMPWSEALQHFTLLTIGDGIAAQLPALIISVATGIIVTRSSADRELSTEILRQFASVPRIPVIVAGVLMALLLLPGMPKWPILAIAALAWPAWRRLRSGESNMAVNENEPAAATVPTAPAAIELRLGGALAAAWQGQEPLILDRIEALRRAQEERLGLAFPAVSIVDGRALPENGYEVRLFGARFGLGEVRPGSLLAIGSGGAAPAIDGIPAADPAFGLPSVWIEPAREAEARAVGARVTDPLTAMLTHLSEVVSGEVATLVTRTTVVSLLEGVRVRQPGLVEELIPTVLGVPDVQRVLQNLLSEGVSIASVDLILEALADLARQQRDPSELTELLRQRISWLICNGLRGDHADLAVLSLAPRIENQILSGLAGAAAGAPLPIEPSLAEKLIRRLASLADAMHREGRTPVLLCGSEIRRHLKGFTRRSIPRLAVLSVSEVPMRINLRSFDVVKLEG